MRWLFIFLLALCVFGDAPEQGAKFAENQCRTVQVSKGDIGEGQLRYCDNGTDQEIYLSGELDMRPAERSEKNAADFLALQQILREFKKRDKGTFRVVTNNAGGGEINWHQDLIIGVNSAPILPGP